MTEERIKEILAVKEPETIQKFLRNIKPLKKFPIEEKIPFETLEKLVRQYYLKYNARIQWINVDFRETGWFASTEWNYSAEFTRICPWHSFVLIRTYDIYELYAKVCLAFHLYSTNGFIDRKGSESRQYGNSSSTTKNP